MIKIYMEIPKSYKECRFCISSYISYCIAKEPVFRPIPFVEERARLNNRPSWCPLQEVKE